MRPATVLLAAALAAASLQTASQAEDIHQPELIYHHPPLPSKRFHFDMGGVDLLTAVRMWGEVTDAEWFANPDALAGLASAPVRGDYTAGDALCLIVGGHDNVAVYYMPVSESDEPTVTFTIGTPHASDHRVC